MKRTTLFIAAAALSISANAVEVYKCPAPTGRLVMQQLPCDGGQFVTINASKAATGEIGVRESELEALKEFARARKVADEARAKEVMREDALAYKRELSAAMREQAEATRSVARAIAIKRAGRKQNGK